MSCEASWRGPARRIVPALIPIKADITTRDPLRKRNRVTVQFGVETSRRSFQILSLLLFRARSAAHGNRNASRNSQHESHGIPGPRSHPRSLVHIEARRLHPRSEPDGGFIAHLRSGRESLLFRSCESKLALRVHPRHLRRSLLLSGAASARQERDQRSV